MEVQAHPRSPSNSLLKKIIDPKMYSKKIFHMLVNTQLLYKLW